MDCKKLYGKTHGRRLHAGYLCVPAQEFNPKTKAALNRAEFGSPDLFVTASGTFEVQVCFMSV